MFGFMQRDWIDEAIAEIVSERVRYRKGEKEEDERKGEGGGVDERKEGGLLFMLKAFKPQLMISNKYNG